MADVLKLAGILGPLLVPFLAVCGMIALLVNWAKIKAFLSGGPAGGTTRRDSELINKLIAQNAEIMGTMVQVVRDNTSALQKVSVAVDAIERGFSTIHRRLDEALAARHHG